jgi:hypothetical protein
MRKARLAFFLLNALSQAISLLIIFSLSRLLNESDFNLFGKCITGLALLTILSHCNTSLLMQVKSDAEVRRANSASFMVLCFSSIAFFVIFSMLNSFEGVLFAISITLGFFYNGLNVAYTNILIRDKLVLKMGSWKFFCILSQLLVVFGCYLFSVSFYLFIFLYFLFPILVTTLFIIDSRVLSRNMILQFEENLVYLKNNLGFLKKSVPSSILNSVSLHGVTYSILALFSNEIGNLFFLIARVVAGPISLISMLLSQLFTGDFTEKIRAGLNERALQTYNKYFFFSLSLGVVGYSLLFFVLSLNSYLFFGESNIVLLIFISCIFYCIRFVFIPTMLTGLLLEKAGFMLIWESARCLSLLLLFLIFYIFESKFELFLSLLSIVYLCFYLMHFFIMKRAILHAKI